MHRRRKSSGACWIRAVLAVAVAFAVLCSVGPSEAQQAGASLPPDLFVKEAPMAAVAVGEARKAVQEGQTVVMRGRIGGLPQPFAEKHAIFVLSDLRLLPCTDGCTTAWDYCCTPKDQILANVATVQVVDGKGRPIKVGMKGINGLKPMSEVIVKGTVIKKSKDLLMVNAHNIYVSSNPK